MLQKSYEKFKTLYAYAVYTIGVGEVSIFWPECWKMGYLVGRVNDYILSLTPQQDSQSRRWVATNIQREAIPEAVHLETNANVYIFKKDYQKLGENDLSPCCGFFIVWFYCTAFCGRIIYKQKRKNN